ncbi:unnamed protein product, partial [Ectocarpus sp. 12 AP-2014]
AELEAVPPLVLCAASTGIAALILPGGLTAHSTFKLPFGDAAVEGSVCNVKAESERVHVLKNASLIIWDEIVMSGKYSPEALDLTLKDLLKNDRPFGGQCVLMSGDWRQVAPVLKFGTPSEIVEHAFLSPHLWKHVKRFRITTSMRDKEDLPYAQTVLAIGEGAIQPIEWEDETAVIPLSHTITNTDGTQQSCTIEGITDFTHLVDRIHPDLLSVDHNCYSDRGILAPTNENIENINNFILDKMQGDSHHQLSTDKLVTDDSNMPDVVSVEYLHEVNVPGTPPHNIHIKLGSLIFFVRNINFDSGLVNGRKGIIRGISRRVLDIEVITEGSRIVKVPRICSEVQVGSRGITFHRHEFPVKLCYAMTMNKSQGQTLKAVGLDLRGDVFCHGQLYVAVF